MGDISYAFRTLRKAPLASVTVVVTVALGLGMVAAVFTLLNVFLFRVDAVPNVHEMFAVERPRTAEGNQVRLTRSEYDALKRETAVFTDVFAQVQTDSRVNGRTMIGALVTGNFFEVLGVSAAQGRAFTPSDDDARNPVLVLSDRGRATHFANEPEVLGRTLLINGVRYEIIGVAPRDFRGLMVGAADYWAPLSLVDQLHPTLAARKKDFDVDVVGRLRHGMSREVALAQLMVWDSNRTGGSAAVERRAITLHARQGTIPQPLEAVALFTPLFVAFGLILLIGCANVGSLLLARGVSRQREIGIRLSLGASRKRIVRQLLIESLILSLAAAVLGYAISRLILETTIWAVLTTMPPDIGDVRLNVPDSDWRVGVFMIAGAIAASIMFGLAPALQATRLELVRTMRGEITRDARPGRTRNVLIGVQVTASALLLISSAVFLRSAMASSTVDPGVRTSDTAVVPIGNEAFRQPIIDALARDPLIVGVAATFPDPITGSRPALAESTQAKATAAYKFVSPAFFSVLGVDILRGRPFTAAEGNINAAVAIVSDSYAKQMWPDGDALGQVLRLAPDPAAPAPDAEVAPPTGSFMIVGVSRDVAGFMFAEGQPARVYVPISVADAGTMLTVRVNSDPEIARRALLERLTAIDPNIEQVVTLRTVAGMATYFLQLAFWLTLVLGALALVLTLSGLFSVLSYLVEQRRKEIGVRMALGATARMVGRLVLGQIIAPVSIGLAVGGGLALATGIVVLTTMASIGKFVLLLDPVAYVVSVLLIVTACVIASLRPTLQAARIEPINTLRQE